jgi:arylsulfatase/arylsulfatase A
MKNDLLLLATLLALPFSSFAAPPNIIIIMPDDMGYGDLGVTGNPVIRTPHLDKFAKESAELTNFYVSPVCSPTRASLMTGRYNQRTRCIDTFKGRSMMEPEEVTIAEMLKEAGYATGIFGKWHLGDNYPMRPQEQGFDEVLIHRGGGLAQPSEPVENKRRYTDAILFHNGQQIQSKGYCTDVYFDAAIEWMKQCQAEVKPFFAYLPPNAPHGPYHDVPEDLLAYYQSTNLTPILNGGKSDKHKDTVARVFAMIENIDQNVGKLEAYLEESNQKDNTLMMFFTDNGPNTMRYVGDFRAMKSHVHEGGIHTMFYARWPERFQAGHVNDRIAAHIDMLPTLAAASGAALPKDVKIDGTNLLPLLRGEPNDWPDRNLVLQTHRGDAPIPFHHMAVRTQDWKLVHPSGFGSEIMNEEVPFELYRITDDLAEADNLAEQMPEKLAELKTVYRNWYDDVSSTRPDNYAPPRIIVGSDYEMVSDLSIQDWRVGTDQGWGSKGKWLVTVAEAGSYTANVQWANPIGEREVTVHLGETTASGTLGENEDEILFTGLKLSAGNADFRVEYSGEQGRQNTPRFLRISRKP